MNYLAVKNYRKFQHYKDRSPPWIKFYRSTLDDPAFTTLSEPARAQLMLLWLVASTCDNRIPYESHFLSQAVRLPRGARLRISELLASGLLAMADGSASTDASDMLAPDDPDASTVLAPRALAREEEETERETETSSSAPAREVEADGVRMLLDELGPTQRKAMVASIAVWKKGYQLPNDAPKRVPTDAEIDQACREVAASVAAGQITAKLVAGFLGRVMRGDEGPSRGKRGKGDPTFLEALRAAGKEKPA